MSRRLVVSVGFVLFLLIGGTVGFVWIEGWTPLDALYMTVITLSTVGFGELRPLSAVGKLFTSVLIVFGVGTLAYTLTKTIEELVEQRVFHRRRMQMDIKRMRDHVIVCGYGRMGETVCDQLRARGVSTVVVDQQALVGTTLDRQGIPHLVLDATDDASLTLAGVEHAKALATVLPHDADNLFVTLTARALNPAICIVSRASKRKSESKMIAAGATRVLNPYRSGGRVLVRQLLHPTVTKFMEELSLGEQADLGIEEVEVCAGSPLAGVTLRESPIRGQMDVIVVGVRRADQRLVFNPPGDLAPEAGDVLVVLGRPDNLARLERLATAAERGRAQP